MLVGNNTALRVRRCRLSQCSLRAATSAHGGCNSEHVSERSSRRFAQSVDIVLGERHIQEPLLRPSMTTEMLCSEAPCAMARTFTAAEPSAWHLRGDAVRSCHTVADFRQDVAAAVDREALDLPLA